MFVPVRHSPNAPHGFLQEGKVVWTVFLISVFFSQSLWGQDLPPKTDPTGRFGQPPPIAEQLPKTTAPQEVLPPLDQENAAQPPTTQLKMFAKEIRVAGSTVFPPRTISRGRLPVCQPRIDH